VISSASINQGIFYSPGLIHLSLNRSMTLSFNFQHTAQDRGFLIYSNVKFIIYRSADKFLARPGR